MLVHLVSEAVAEEKQQRRTFSLLEARAFSLLEPFLEALVAITHRLVQLPLGALAEPWVQYERIYRWVRDAFRHPHLTIVTERVWGQIVPSLGGVSATDWCEQFMPRLVNPEKGAFRHEDTVPESTRADVYLTVVAERHS